MDAGQQKNADDQKTLPTRLDRPLELQISQDMQLEDGWRVHDDDHKLDGWNVLGPDLPGEQFAQESWCKKKFFTYKNS